MMQSAPTPDTGAARPVADDLRRFLNGYWLRPENAFWMVLRSHVLAPFAMARASIDISCGDGCFMFLHAGGAFDPDFDVFRGVGRLDDVRDGHADMFDYVDEAYRPRIAAPPAWRIDVGTDWKQALLDKAAPLGLYDTLIRHDNNEPLPMADGRFATVYCNSVYWVERVEAFLREIRRITAADGKILLEIKLASILRYTLAGFRDVLGDRWLEIIDRGRAATWTSLTDRATWERRFAAAGLAIEHAIPFITRTHAHLWDIGLRPIAPMLVKMANALAPDTRRAIKAEWVDLFVELLEPFTRPDLDLFSDRADPVEILYVLRPA
ncbi:MAG: class I SAM-dependent methyltransferase [Phycisphaerae bacterium]|nr:class I SAM-dependent methyltransferase [Phycisphaerae bacterium]